MKVSAGNLVKKIFKKNAPKVSVLMAAYKTPEQYLREAIESILNQTFTDFEFLILDDCPTESVEDIVKSYDDKRIKYLKNPQNLGISQTRNKLIDLAKGQYLAVMDHDDVSLPERLEKEVFVLDSHSEIGVVGCWYETFPHSKIKKRYVLNSQIEKDLMYNCSILHPSSMIRKAVLDKNNIRYEEEFSPAEDHALWCRLLGKTQFTNIPEVLQKYRDYRGNTSKLQAAKMKAASRKIHLMLEKQYPQLMAQASETQTFKICGLPLVKRQRKGCNLKYTWLGLFKIIRREDILFPDANNLPIYIICYNRLTYLKEIISWLESHNLKNIHIIDNCSTYPPLIKYLQNTPYTVHRMTENLGHMVFFKADEFKSVRENEYYVLTDPGVIGIENCPKDFMCYFYNILQKYPKCNKVGFSFKTDDIPDIESKKLYTSWEKQFYKHKLTLFPPYLYASSLDTTFAMYRPQKDWLTNNFYKAVRTDAPYQARHLPWYKDLNNLSEEDKYYTKTDCGSGNYNDKAGVERVKEYLISKPAEHWWENIFSFKSSDRRSVMRIFGIKFTLKHKK
ncbi:MAG: glycosyltransferase [Alphaproteobacteria bacterium]|nr:glycosyltransferase [Alphaproteobacteria bacterium]